MSGIEGVNRHTALGLLDYCPTSTTVTLVVALAGFIAGVLIVWRLLR